MIRVAQGEGIGGGKVNPFDVIWFFGIEPGVNDWLSLFYIVAGLVILAAVAGVVGEALYGKEDE